MEKNIKKFVMAIYILVALVSMNTCGIIYLLLNTHQKEVTYNTSMMKQLNVEEAVQFIESGKEVILYLGRSTCAYCVKILPSLVKAQMNLEYTTKYIDIEEVDTKTKAFNTLIDFMDKEIEMENEVSTFGKLYDETPMLVIFRDGKMVDGFVGYQSYEEILKFLTANGIN